jgi:hypothetical protein
MPEKFDWLRPSVLWGRGGAGMTRPDFFRPTLLGFKSDNFMEEALAAAAAPAPQPFEAALARPERAGSVLRLFQPTHGCFYLTSASLCCRQPGFPDRQLRGGDGESVFFVMRKVVNNVEYAWSVDGEHKGWRSLGGDPLRVLAGEERQPLFQAPTAEGRPVFFGYVPVASRETYAAAPNSDDNPIDYTFGDLRLHELRARFTGPLAKPSALFPSSADAGIQLRTSVYLLLDLWEYFDTYVNDLGRAVRTGSDTGLLGAKLALLNELKRISLGGSLKLEEALRTAATKQAVLNAPGELSQAGLGSHGFDQNYNLRTILFDGSHPAHRDLVDFIGRAGLFAVPDGGLETKVKAVFDAQPASVAPPVEVPRAAPRAEDARYLLRHVYERPQCDESHRHTVSRPTELFELAPFFDPEAPARDIRVALPVDVSVAGLRKFKKNVAFMMSKELRAKLDSIAGQESDVLKGQATATGPSLNIGLICSFSIPIITICAFILLMIIVSLLHIVFWWIPLLRICFPLRLSAR